MDIDIISAIKELSAVAWLGLLSWQTIKMKKNGNAVKLESKIDEANERIYKLAQCVARIEGHLKIKEEP